MSYRFRTFAEDDTAAVVALWEACGLLRPWNDPYRDIARKTAEQPELFLVAESTDAAATDAAATEGTATDAAATEGTATAAAATEGTATAAAATEGTAPATLVGVGMAGYDGHRGWVNYLAVHPDQQGTGLGRAFMAEFERLLLARGCPKVNVQVRAGNERVIGFYASLGYAEDHAVSLGKRLVADD